MFSIMIDINNLGISLLILQDEWKIELHFKFL